MKRFGIAALLLLAGCGSTPTAPTPPPAPAPVPAAIAGGWSGTFETITYSTTPIVVDLNQIGATVTGTWASTGGGAVRPFGNINGTVDPTSFIGTITYNFTGGPTCTASFSGTASATTLNWSSPGFTTGSCGLAAPGNPLNVRFVLQRRQ